MSHTYHTITKCLILLFNFQKFLCYHSAYQDPFMYDANLISQYLLLAIEKKSINQNLFNNKVFCNYRVVSYFIGVLQLPT